MADLVLVNPRFEITFWGLEYALPIYGKRATTTNAALPLLAALVPPEHRVTLIDENVEPLDFDRLARADLVGLTGMGVQRRRMREILEELKRRRVFTVVGGPWASVDERFFEGLADVVFVGEADDTWPRFLREWCEGRHQARYEQAARTDMARLPVPRYDLLKMDRYLFGSMQISRGCPHQCEFCDIVVMFGRTPRLKTAAQVIAEIEALRRQKKELVFIVDDNLIGNRRAVKPLLDAVAAWQRREGYPLAFFTEASLDLAEDGEMMRLMVEANVLTVFVGVESPNDDSLRETKKLHNLRPGTPMADRVRAIQAAGIEVWCGMMLGFDHDGPEIFEAHRRFAREARLTYIMLGMLRAIPKTPLYARLASEGRLDLEGQGRWGTNVVPAAMTRQELAEGFARLMADLYEPGDYFDRFEALYLEDRLALGQACRRYWRRHPWRGLKAQSIYFARAVVLYGRLMRFVKDPDLRREYRRRFFRMLWRRRDPVTLVMAVHKCAAHYHHYTVAKRLLAGQVAGFNTY